MIFTSYSLEIEVCVKRHGTTNDEGIKVNVKLSQLIKKKIDFIHRLTLIIFLLLFGFELFGCFQRETAKKIIKRVETL